MTTTRRLLTLTTIAFAGLLLSACSDTTTETANACGPAFDTFVGLAYEDSTLDIYQLFPTEDTWEQLDDRLISCLIYDPSNPEVTGTLAGAAR